MYLFFSLRDLFKATVVSTTFDVVAIVINECSHLKKLDEDERPECLFCFWLSPAGDAVAEREQRHIFHFTMIFSVCAWDQCMCEDRVCLRECLRIVLCQRCQT
jgi:hypothetical protein